jgi:hypothetical protein
MADSSALEDSLRSIMTRYAASFTSKVYLPESEEGDLLMNAFGLSPELKRENRQYWGRELGMCWQRIVVTVFRAACSDYRPPIRQGADELCDLCEGTDAIDTKYRIGSGDSGTLKKFRQYGGTLRGLALRPVLHIVRTDNLPAALAACRSGGWEILQGSDSFEFVKDKTSFDLGGWLLAESSAFRVDRSLK